MGNKLDSCSIKDLLKEKILVGTVDRFNDGKSAKNVRRNMR